MNNIKLINDFILYITNERKFSKHTIRSYKFDLNYSKNTSSNEPIQGVFSLKYLCLFTKCTNLCNLLHMYIKNDYPLVIKYDIANLGHIKLCLSPNTETD